MESYQEIIHRLNKQLKEIDENSKKPLADVANKYRISAEAICKAIIVGHENEYKNNQTLEQLISAASKIIEKNEANRDSILFKAEIKYLQQLGNTYSHDTPNGAITEKESQNRAFSALTKIIRIAFFGNGNLDAPKIPATMENNIPFRTLGRTKFENPRAEEVVHLCFPNKGILTKIKRSDHSNRLVYDYLNIDLGAGASKGFIFLRSRTALEKSLTDFLSSCENKFPDSLEIITPRAYRPDGGEIDRHKSISDAVRELSLDKKVFTQKERVASIKYFDDFVWHSCLPESFRANPSPKKRFANFIEQTVTPLNNQDESTESYQTSTYISKILKSSNDFGPIHVITGPAGIGKTTFCDDIAAHINARDHKRVILLSATDFREISIHTTINSVSDLYSIAEKNGWLEDATPIESHNFEINLACGNFVLLIDGFDELESHLGSSLNFDNFMNSLAALEECFRKVLVIMTVRNYNLERFKDIRQVSILELHGFSYEDTDRYLTDRLKNNKSLITKAKKLLQTFDENTEHKNKTTIPLYASLICDYLNDDDPKLSQNLLAASESAKFFSSGNPLDTLVKKIVDREIRKQSLGKIGPDDFFEILIEIIKAPQHTVTKEALIEYISACDSDAQLVDPANFMRNPFLLWRRETVSFKYDSLIHFFKSRLLARKIKDGQFSEIPTVDFMAEFCRGDGPLYDEFMAALPSRVHAKAPNTKKWFTDLLEQGSRANELTSPWRKTISAFMYWAENKSTEKKERSNNISTYFGSTTWRFFSIYGQFYPISLEGIKIEDGHIENYTNISKCDYVPETAVFYTTQITFEDQALPRKLDRSLFGTGCKLSQNISKSFEAKKAADKSEVETISSNIYRILKVGFRSNNFSWKSKNIYKTATVTGRLSLDSYLEFLSTEGVLEITSNRADGEPGYVVSEEWTHDARKLIEEGNPTSKITKIIDALMNTLK